ncbi:hypothetical protein [Methanolacinia paynteri]|uniref:hypothetical protein n=1 Tax=Methanolacinia paynteri TaxID=230356 RepID=UPI001FE1004D|nr:hypothetical protein [Methanolacinia paynteri]
MIKMNSKAIKFSIAACLILLMVAVSGVASAYSISAQADEKQLEIINEIYGQDMTQGEFWEMVFPEEYALMKKNLSDEEFKEFCSTEKYWGDDYQELPYGANVWDKNGPVSLASLTEEQKSSYGLENLKTDNSGYIIQGSNSEASYLVDKLYTLLDSKSALVLYANDLGRSGSSITYSGTGRVSGGTASTSLTVTIELYGDDSRVAYVVNYGTGSSTVTVGSAHASPRTGVVYQSKVIGTSTNPSLSGYTWSPARQWPFS